MTRRHEQRVRALLADPRAIRWEYDRGEWLRYLDAERARPQLLPWLLFGLFAFTGSFAAWLYVANGDAIGGSAARTWLLLGGGGLVAGAVAGLFEWFVRRTAHERRRSAEGIFCAGEAGVYLTGVYWPWYGAGFGFRSCVFEPGPPPRALFRFSLPRSGVSELRVPVPADRVEEARSWIGAIGGA
jgi:hypothetical protein